jgi:YebC/PmpR family DNA-binding regulatory protein
MDSVFTSKIQNWYTPMGRKWANIVAKKTAKDGANSKVYAKFGVEIYVAAKRGGSPEPEANSLLKFTIEKAKQAQVPRHVIDNAIKKAEGKSDETFVDGRYEGFGPSGSMIICETLTSNVNRTIADVRTIFHKNGGNIAGEGAVSYMFDNTGVIVFKGTDPDAVLEKLLDAEVDVRDVSEDEGNIIVYTEPTDLHKGIEALRADGVEEFIETELELIPQNEVELNPEDLEVFQGLVDALEDNDDVQKVYHNVSNV